MFFRQYIWFLCLASFGCTSSDVTETDTNDSPLPAQQVSDWCLALYGGPEGARSDAQDFARAHVGHRVFGPTGKWRDADDTLVSTLATHAISDPEFLSQYTASFSDVCAADATPQQQKPGTLEQWDSRARIVPGQDTPSVSSQVDTVIIDLREPHTVEHVLDALRSVVSGTVQLGSRTQRKLLGFPAQETGWTHYESELFEEPLQLVGTADRTRDIIFWTGQRLHPEVALWVGALRLNEAAMIVGYDVHTAVAESTWSGMGSAGLAWRSSTVRTNGSIWPDVISADISTSTPEWYQDTPITWGPIGDTTLRTPMGTYIRDAGEPETETSAHALSAALLVAYGTLDWFYPYFDIVGRDLDAALGDELAFVASNTDLTRRDMKQSIGRLMHSVHDGHGYVYDWAPDDWPAGYLAVQLQQVDEEPVIRTSQHPGLYPGDTLTSIDGTPASEWYANTITHYSAASQGYHFVMASDELKEMYGPLTLGVRAPNGTLRTETVSPQPWSVYEEVAWGGSLRPSGWLTDLGAESVFYVNMSGQVMPDESVVTDQWNVVSAADAIILDMRDYPNLDIYGFAGYFRATDYTAPWFDFPTWMGPQSFDWEREIWSFSPISNPFTGPIVLLVSNYSVSAAECFVQMLEGLDHVTIVGQQSASTNGTVTNVWLPGNIQIYFTGMRLLNLDGSHFHGEGIQPDIVVHPDPTALAEGIDPEIETALDTVLP